MAEELLATLQVLLADLAGTDLCLLRTSVDVEISLEEIPRVVVKPIPSNTQTRWKIILPAGQGEELRHSEIFALATQLLTSASVLPSDQLLGRLEDAFRQGLSDKTFFGQRYRKLYFEFITSSSFELSGRKSKSVPQVDRAFRPPVHRELAWCNTIGPRYSRESVETALKNRYARGIVPVRHTLARLVKEPSFKATVRKLKGEGWLDWHVLNVVAQATLNYRISLQMGSHRDIDEHQRRFTNLMNQEEDSSQPPVPLFIFSEDSLRFGLRALMVSTLKSLGLMCHQQTPDFKAIGDFLGQRYNYWKDDIPHPDYGF